MADQLEQFMLNATDLGITDTNELDRMEMAENFLNSDPEDLKFIPVPPKKTKKVEETEEEEEEDEIEVKPIKKAKKEIKEVIITPNEETEEDLYTKMNDKVEDDPSKKKVEGQTPKEGEDNETEEGTEENIFASISKELFQHGIFTQQFDEEGAPIDEEIDTAEDMLSRFQYEGRKQAADTIDRFLSKYGEDYKEMFKSVFVDGIKPEDYLNRYTKIQSVKGLDITKEDNQERVVRELYRSEGRSAEYIDKRLTQLKNYNDLADEATEAQRILVEKETSAIENEGKTKKDEEARKVQMRNEYVASVTRILNDKEKAKEFDGIPITRDLVVDTYNYITKEQFKLPNNQLLTEFDKDVLDLTRPENHERKVKIAILMQLLKKDPKLTSLGKAAVSKESNELFKSLKKQVSKQGGPKPNPSNDKSSSEPKSWFSVTNNQ